MSFQFDLGHPGEMNYNFYLDSSGACVRWTPGSGDAGSVPEAELAGLKGSDSYKHNKNPDWWMLHTG